MPKWLQDPEKLRRRLEELREQKKTADLDAYTREALAEGSFRLAVHPATQAVAALELLNRAVRLDGSNPKYAYHLARLYFLHGQLTLAANWLQHAHRLCPTSHRIWCHLSLLQREINRLYKGNPDYEPDALRKRSDVIAGEIIAGQDQLDPALLDCAPPKESQHKSGNPEKPRMGPEEEPAVASATGPAAPVQRFLRPRQCRWKGVYDLDFEHLLEASPSERNQKRLYPLLLEAANAAPHGSQSMSRFAILGIEWLISGYPVTTVRRLSKGFSLIANTPSLEVMNLVCTFYEAEIEACLGLLATALAGRRLPPLLAALVHQRRLLWRPLEFRSPRTYRLARQFLTKVGQDPPADEESRQVQAVQAEEYAGHLRRALQLLQVEPPKPLADFAEAAARLPDYEAAWLRFQYLEECGSKLGSIKEDAFRFLKDELSPLAEAPPDEVGYARARADFKTLKDISEALLAVCDTGIGMLPSLEEAISRRGADSAPENFIQRKEGSGKQLVELKALGNFNRRLSKIDGQLKGAGERFQAVSSHSPSGKISQILAEIKAIHRVLLQEAAPGEDDPQMGNGPAVETAAEALPLPEAAKEEDAPSATVGEAPEVFGIPALEKGLEETDTAITQLFHKALATFKPYAPEDRRLPAIQELMASVQAQQAETLYRLGRYRRARLIWNDMLLVERLDAKILKNIAVCDTRGPDLGECLIAWRSYLEMLYFYSLVAGSPRPQARTRADFHRAFGNSYAPAFLSKTLDKEEKPIDELTILSFCASPGRVRNFVEHKLLEFLNAKLDFTSPPLILGVSRAEGETVRSQARETLGAFLDEAARCLPARVRGAFVGLVKRHLEQAWQACASARRLTAPKDPRYAEELPRQAEILKDFAQLKIKLVRAVQQNQELSRHLVSVDFLQELARLDQIPLALSDELLRPVAYSFGIEKAETLQNLIQETLCGHVVKGLLNFIFSAPESPEAESLRLRQYRNLMDQWVHQPALRDFRDFIDDPQQFYPPEIEKTFADEKQAPEAVEILYHWQARYPELTGPARLLAMLLNQEKKFEAAVAVLSQAIEKGFHAERVITCHFQRMVSWYYRAGAAVRDKDEGARRQALQQARADARQVLDKSKDANEIEQARNIENQIEKHLRGS